jgi:hypothetical protein
MSYIFASLESKGVVAESPIFQSDGSAKPQWVYLSARDYATQAMEAPRLSARDLEGFVRIRLSRYFPDQGAKAPVSIVPTGIPRVVQALFGSVKTMAAYREAFPQARFSSLLSLSAPPARPALRVVIGPAWCEWAFLLDRGWTEPQRKSLDPQGSWLSAIRSEATAVKQSALFAEIYCSPRSEEAATHLMKSLAESNAIVSRKRDLGKTLMGPFSKARPLFLAVQGKSGIPVWITPAIALIGVALLNAGILKLSLKADRDAETLITGMREIQAQEAQVRGLKAELAPLEASAALTQIRRTPAYDCLLALSASTSPKARLLEFTMDFQRFSMTLEAQDALSTLESLKKTGLFKNLEISGIQPSEGLERFTLRGERNEAR